MEGPVIPGPPGVISDKYSIGSSLAFLNEPATTAVQEWLQPVPGLLLRGDVVVAGGHGHVLDRAALAQRSEVPGTGGGGGGIHLLVESTERH